MATVPKLIRIERHGHEFSMTVDGEEFPYAIRDDDLDVSVALMRGGSVRLTLLADRVELVNDFEGPPLRSPVPEEEETPDVVSVLEESGV